MNCCKLIVINNLEFIDKFIVKNSTLAIELLR